MVAYRSWVGWPNVDVDEVGLAPKIYFFSEGGREGGGAFPGFFGKRCTRCMRVGSMPSVETIWRTNVVSLRFLSMRFFA